MVIASFHKGASLGGEVKPAGSKALGLGVEGQRLSRIPRGNRGRGLHSLHALATRNGARLLATETEDVHGPQLFFTFGT